MADTSPQPMHPQLGMRSAGGHSTRSLGQTGGLRDLCPQQWPLQRPWSAQRPFPHPPTYSSSHLWGSWKTCPLTGECNRAGNGGLICQDSSVLHLQGVARGPADCLTLLTVFSHAVVSHIVSLPNRGARSQILEGGPGPPLRRSRLSSSHHSPSHEQRQSDPGAKHPGSQQLPPC